MKQSMKWIILCSFLVFAGCAHSTMRGSVAMKVSDNEAHVCLGDNEVKIGDKVTLYKSECSGSNAKFSGGRVCQKVNIGAGQVTQVLNEHYSVIKVEPDVKFQEGTIVEKN